ncbi:MAG: hypothetical protein KGP14_12360, partial [Betaproteobacteria bacterium]|nr:hypothetical protein [Betaproteobacteria bacterium]
QAQKSSPFPPTLPEFLRLCRDAANRKSAAQSVQALNAPPISKDVAAQRLAQIEVRRKPDHSGGLDPLGWALAHREAYLSGVRLSPVQISFASAALGETWSGGKCSSALPGDVRA